MIRGALVALLSLEEDIEVVAELDGGDRVLDVAEETRPDVAVLDIDMPGLDGLTVAARLHERLPDCHTLILTGLSQPGNLLRALRAHVRGFIVKDAPLTSRETDVLREAAAGIPTDQIGTRLSLSPATVRNYLSSAISKVGGHNRIDAIRVARQNGWL